mmetsp:Transcript_3602/g.5303  ORF Transcript_3602/g.5303 Transcript_3602/m.5303 type:complete len:449 (-) Transcript_3602:582-1928(-)
MSDNEDYMDEDVEFGGEDFDEDIDSDSDGNLMENTYYNAKAEEEVEEAIEGFQMILDMEEEPSEWGFKALKQMIKRQFKQKLFDDMNESYKLLLERMGGGSISRNDCERAINKVLTLVSSATDTELLAKIYSVTLDALQTMNNDPLWVNTKLKLGRLYMKNANYDKLKGLIDDLKSWCLGNDGQNDPSKSSHLLEIYVLEIQMYTQVGDLKRLKKLYQKCKEVSSGAVVLNPGITGTIHECGGKMHMREKLWAQAYSDFFEAFKSYDEAGNSQRIKCLKYLVLAAMLTSNQTNKMVNPFDANEAKSYRNHRSIVAMTNLIDAYENSDIISFERLLKQNKKEILDDEFMRDYIDDLRRNIQVKVIVELIKPYTRVRLGFLADKLKVNAKDVESICMDLILDQKLEGHIDQVQQILILGNNRDESMQQRYKALDDWCDQIESLHQTILAK